MKLKSTLLIIAILVYGHLFSQLDTIPYSQISIDGIENSVDNVNNLKVTISNNDPVKRWSPASVYVFDLNGDTVAGMVYCGCVLLMNGSTTDFFLPLKTAFTVPQNYCCKVQLVDLDHESMKNYGGCNVNTDINNSAFKNNLDLNLFPNPAKSILNINLNLATNSNYKIALLDIHGQNVMTENINSSKSQLNIESLTSGLYFVQLYTNGILIETKKLTIN